VQRCRRLLRRVSQPADHIHLASLSLGVTVRYQQGLIRVRRLFRRQKVEAHPEVAHPVKRDLRLIQYRAPSLALLPPHVPHLVPSAALAAYLVVQVPPHRGR